MKKYILILTALLPFLLHAQDTIVKKNGTRIPANVTEVSTDHIRYNLPGTDGPPHILRTSEVNDIHYSSGRTERIASSASNNAGSFGSMLHKQMISINTIDLTFGLVTLNYELNLAGGKFSIRVPVSTGISAWSNSASRGYSDMLYYSRFKYISTGIDFLYYPKGQAHTFSYYTGVSTEGGLVRNPGYILWDFPPYPPSQTFYGGAGIVNGVLVNVNERLNVSGYVTLGMRYHNMGYFGYDNPAMCRFGLTMGIRLGKPTLKS
jgi:hypothetical protein